MCFLLIPLLAAPVLAAPRSGLWAMAKPTLWWTGIMPIEAAIYNLRLDVDQAPKEITEAHGQNGQRGRAYMRDANGGNALSKLARYETSLLREYDRSRQELEKLQKIRAARPTPPPSPANYEGNPISPVSPIPPTSSRPTQSTISTLGPGTQNPPDCPGVYSTHSSSLYSTCALFSPPQAASGFAHPAGRER
jgi:hypothetical protein